MGYFCRPKQPTKKNSWIPLASLVIFILRNISHTIFKSQIKCPPTNKCDLGGLGTCYRGSVGSVLFMFLYCVSLSWLLPTDQCYKSLVWGLQNQRRINKKRTAFPFLFVFGDSASCKTLIGMTRDTVLSSTSPLFSRMNVFCPQCFPTSLLSTFGQIMVNSLHEKGVISDQLIFSPLLPFLPACIILLEVLLYSEHPGHFTALRTGQYQVIEAL